jgi:hypothetical protein
MTDEVQRQPNVPTDRLGCDHRPWVNEQGESTAHVECSVHIRVRQLARVLKKLKNWRNCWKSVDNICQSLSCAHELPPSVTGNVRGVVEINAASLEVLDERTVQRGWIEKHLAQRPISRIRGNNRLQSLGQSAANRTSKRKPIGVNSSRRRDEDCIPRSQSLSVKKTLLGPYDPNGRAAQYSTIRSDDRIQRLCLTSSVSSGKSGRIHSGKSGTPLKGARDGAKRS